MSTFEVNPQVEIMPPLRHTVMKMVGRSTLFGIAANFVQLATRLITVPIVLSHLGLDGYGIWSIIMTAAAYMRFGSVGIKSAFQKYVAEATGKGDFERTNNLLTTGSSGMLILSLVGLIPVSIFARTIAHYVGVPARFESSAAGAVSLLALTMVVSNSGAAFEAIVMGAHRIDLVRKFNILTTVLEAVAILILLRLGYGLFAMAAVMAASEIAYIVFCWYQSRRILPAVQLRACYLSRSVLSELTTFGGSYQLVSVLEILYLAVLPVTVLKFFGANAAGVYAIATRLATAAMLPQEALLQPILSGSSMILATGRSEHISHLLSKALKMSLMLSVPPLAFVFAFGGTIVLAWTGEPVSLFRIPLILITLATLFKSISLLELVLYRASGHSVLDNCRQVLRIVLVVILGFIAPYAGFNGVLSGLAVTELAGMIFMYFALSGIFNEMSLNLFVKDSITVLLAALVVMAVGLAVTIIPVPWPCGMRMEAILRMIAVAFACVLAAYPAVLLTGCLSKTELRSLKALLSNKVYAGA